MDVGVRSIHHINILVRDLDAAEARFRRLLGFGPAVREALHGRGVATARFRIGDAWLVLVQPVSEDGAPARHLREHGEGFFLLSLGVDDLDGSMAAIRSTGAELDAAQPREGLDGWRVIDIDNADTFGVQLQLTELPGEGERRDGS